MKTNEVKSLVQEVLTAMPKPYSAHVIDEAFQEIEREPQWHREYEALCSSLGKTTVNTWGGYWIANTLGKVGKQQVPSKKSTLIGSYSILDTDAKVLSHKPKEPEALQLMADYYQAHKDQFSPEVRKHRELIVGLIMEGMSPEEAFSMILKSDPSTASRP